jgi:hypothetical protein
VLFAVHIFCVYVFKQQFYFIFIIIIIIIIIIVIFVRGLGLLNCSGIDALPSFPGASTLSSSSSFVLFHHYHHHRYLPSWIRSFELFQDRRFAIVSWGVHYLFFL